MRAFGKKHGIDVRTHVSRPTLSSSWAVRVVSGRALPSYFEHCRGKRQFAPKIDNPMRPAPCMEIGRIYVGNDWDVDGHPLRPTGLRSDDLEMLSDFHCGKQLRTGHEGPGVSRDARGA